ncbi:Rhodanese-like protein [Glonium stellatum]|uniref:Rhodanese-like protein n=1 Tax=Glonium stellatum TaxID=574774 RepID=A0A8E2JXS3_9PEZI|nr:Rhodanese-like protein [Glonium stellatum]
MSEATISNLQYITREDLSAQLLSSDTKPSNSPALPPSVAIIDVRDSDHVGGHIRGSTHIPSSQLDYKVPELVRTLKDKEAVVFHCALSQQRGPSAALRYIRERKRLLAMPKEGAVREDSGNINGQVESSEQKVLVLEGGFVKWQEKYGEDKRLTDAYQKDIWMFGY